MSNKRVISPPRHSTRNAIDPSMTIEENAREFAEFRTIGEFLIRRNAKGENDLT